MAPGWFAAALHALALIANAQVAYPSAQIAASLNVHPVFARRILAVLVKSGLLAAREGRDGGYRLTRPAEQITLAEVYRVMGSEALISPSPNPPDPLCPVGAGIQGALGEVTSDAELAFLEVLSWRTIADLANRAVELGEAGSL